MNDFLRQDFQLYALYPAAITPGLNLALFQSQFDVCSQVLLTSFRELSDILPYLQAFDYVPLQFPWKALYKPSFFRQY